MLEPETLIDVVRSMDEIDVARVQRTDKEFCVFYLNVFNAGHAVAISLTDHPERLKKIDENHETVRVEEIREILDANG